MLGALKTVTVGAAAMRYDRPSLARLRLRCCASATAGAIRGRERRTDADICYGMSIHLEAACVFWFTGRAALDDTSFCPRFVTRHAMQLYIINTLQVDNDHDEVGQLICECVGFDSVLHPQRACVGKGTNLKAW
jgi:hypothetical protein